MAEYTDRNVAGFEIHNLTEEKFQELKAAGQINPNAIYMTPDKTVANFDAVNARVDVTETDIAGLKQSKQDIATAVNYDNISNCITEIPQDIKLELNNGTLTLKAGSKVYVPNGSGVFDAVTTTADVSTTRTDSQDCIVWRYPSGSLGIFPTRLFYSGETAPTEYKFMFWYDTTNNLCKYTSDYGSTWPAGMSFPVCLVETDGTKISAIKQVFNGFGYVGATVFALPGIKGLISNGRNADLSLKSNALNITRVLTYAVHGTSIKQVRISNSSLYGYLGYIVSDTKPSGNFNMWYNPVENIMYDTGSAGTPSALNAIAGISVEYNGTRITSFTPKTVFHAVDYNDTHFIAHQAMPSGRYIALSTGIDSGYNYTAPADGYLTINKGGSAGDWLYMRNPANGLNAGVQYTGSYNGRLFIPVQKGHTIQVQFQGSGTINEFRFIYANGAK